MVEDSPQKTQGQHSQGVDTDKCASELGRTRTERKVRKGGGRPEKPTKRNISSRRKELASHTNRDRAEGQAGGNHKDAHPYLGEKGGLRRAVVLIR